jgi:NAD(P)-dependent dehydrogenase (short-subunit alcohol dehydrogenase family)
MAKRLTGKVAVVTGSGSPIGIGHQVALLMATEGANVVVNDIGKDSSGNWSADNVVNEIKKSGGSAVANYDSVANMEGCRNIIKTAIVNFSRIDILVNTAGNFLSKPTVDTTEKEWDLTMAIHLKGPFALCQAAVKKMITQKSGGRIINFTSGAAFPPMMPGGAVLAYAAAKAGILGFTKALSLEMQPYGITVNAISPNAVTGLFPMTRGPGSQPGPEHVAPLVVYLATDEAKDITGQIIYTSGGDLCIYAPPMGVGANQNIYKPGIWTVDELIQIMPRMLGK